MILEEKTKMKSKHLLAQSPKTIYKKLIILLILFSYSKSIYQVFQKRAPEKQLLKLSSTKVYNLENLVSTWRPKLDINSITCETPPSQRYISTTLPLDRPTRLIVTTSDNAGELNDPKEQSVTLSCSAELNNKSTEQFTVFFPIFVVNYLLKETESKIDPKIKNLTILKSDSFRLPIFSDSILSNKFILKVDTTYRTNIDLIIYNSYNWFIFSTSLEEINRLETLKFFDKIGQYFISISNSNSKISEEWYSVIRFYQYKSISHLKKLDFKKGYLASEIKITDYFYMNKNFEAKNPIVIFSAISKQNPEKSILRIFSYKEGISFSKINLDSKLKNCHSTVENVLVCFTSKREIIVLETFYDPILTNIILKVQFKNLLEMLQSGLGENPILIKFSFNLEKDKQILKLLICQKETEICSLAIFEFLNNNFFYFIEEIRPKSFPIFDFCPLERSNLFLSYSKKKHLQLFFSNHSEERIELRYEIELTLDKQISLYCLENKSKALMMSKSSFFMYLIDDESYINPEIIAGVLADTFSGIFIDPLIKIYDSPQGQLELYMIDKETPDNNIQIIYWNIDSLLLLVLPKEAGNYELRFKNQKSSSVQIEVEKIKPVKIKNLKMEILYENFLNEKKLDLTKILGIEGSLQSITMDKNNKISLNSRIKQEPYKALVLKDFNKNFFYSHKKILRIWENYCDLSKIYFSELKTNVELIRAFDWSEDWRFINHKLKAWIQSESQTFLIYFSPNASYITILNLLSDKN